MSSSYWRQAFTCFWPMKSGSQVGCIPCLGGSHTGSLLARLPWKRCLGMQASCGLKSALGDTRAWRVAHRPEYGDLQYYMTHEIEPLRQLEDSFMCSWSLREEIHSRAAVTLATFGSNVRIRASSSWDLSSLMQNLRMNLPYVTGMISKISQSRGYV